MTTLIKISILAITTVFVYSVAHAVPYSEEDTGTSQKSGDVQSQIATTRSQIGDGVSKIQALLGEIVELDRATRELKAELAQLESKVKGKNAAGFSRLMERPALHSLEYLTEVLKDLKTRREKALEETIANRIQKQAELDTERRKNENLMLQMSVLERKRSQSFGS